jgi:hypothetical protein
MGKEMGNEMGKEMVEEALKALEHLTMHSAEHTPAVMQADDGGNTDDGIADGGCACIDGSCYHSICRYQQQCKGSKEAFGRGRGWWGGCVAPGGQAERAVP